MTYPNAEPVYFLLVDDLEGNLLALEALLRRDGLVLLKANSGAEALELLLSHDVALALIDVQMPGMDGFELAELMRGTIRTRRVPIIFITAGSADRQRRFQGYEAGAVDFLHKPVEPDILCSKAEVFYELYRQRQEVAFQRDELKVATQENARLLAESQRQAAALREADQRKDEFLAMLAHELRNPLAPVQNAVEVLRLADPTDPTITTAREIISRQVSHMARLVNDLLDVARIARGKIELKREKCDLVEIVRHTTEDYRAQLSMAGVALELNIPAAPTHVLCDKTRIAQVLGNLLHNASKFTPSGGSVTVSVSEELANKAAVVKVVDTGAGLKEVDIDRLFEPFIQADQSLARGQGGLGLGLALAKRLVELHGGSIEAESAGLGQGSTFTLRLPMIMHHQLESREETTPSLSVASKLKILIVEDNEDAAKSMLLLVNLLGHEGQVAYDGLTGVKAAYDYHPDVIISDLGLPGELNGYGLAEQIRTDSSFSNTLLVALSGYGQEEDRKKAKQAGFDKHFVKPIDISRLEEILLPTQASKRLHSQSDV